MSAFRSNPELEPNGTVHYLMMVANNDKGKKEEEGPDDEEEMWDWANEETDGSFESEYSDIKDKETKIGAQATSIIIDLVK